jgi:hypothetical protein
MKIYKFTILLLLGLLVFSCDLVEEPPFLANENVYGTANDATAALKGIYQSVAQPQYYGNEFIALCNLNSGFGVTGKGGQYNNNTDNTTICSLKPNASTDYLTKSWSAIYKSIGRSNDAIKSAIVTENPTTDDEMVINEVVGQAHFLRAFNYFNLVRLWGEVPLRTMPTDTETLHLGKTSVKEVYALIISDAERAKSLMTGAIENRWLQTEAVDMLLAKVYMTLATAPAELQDPGLNYWQMAYNEAKKAYGSRSLHSDYDDLFRTSGNNSDEALFELQSSEEASLNHTWVWTPWYYSQATTLGWFLANYEVHDLHVATYPGDPRLSTTFISQYATSQGWGFQAYPVNPWRMQFWNAFPFLFKLGAKDQSNTSVYTNLNFKIYRYADLLLMLSEISNELQNGEALGYVTEVLDRVGLAPHAGYAGDQASFRSAIMKEYQFELFFEGHDWFNNRRRGYTYFLNNVIIPHNTAPKFNPDVDVTLDDNEATIMYLPFPQTEIDANELIN